MQLTNLILSAGIEEYITYKTRLGDKTKIVKTARFVCVRWSLFLLVQLDICKV